jgi:hypothetical protein
LPLAIAQEHDMSQMQMGAPDPAGSDLINLASGTSENPESGSLPMLMQMHARLEFHVDGPSLRGGYAANRSSRP